MEQRNPFDNPVNYVELNQRLITNEEVDDQFYDWLYTSVIDSTRWAYDIVCELDEEDMLSLFSALIECDMNNRKATFKYLGNKVEEKLRDYFESEIMR